MPQTMTGRVEALWLKRAILVPMDPVEEATLIVDEGIEADANRGRSHRQVTIIEAEVFERLRERLPDALPEMRRANIMVSGIRLAESRGQVLRLGGTLIGIKGETRPCERMDEQCAGLRSALEPEWGGGVYGTILEGGQARVGDSASLEPPA